jgi:hypothetical protein
MAEVITPGQIIELEQDGEYQKMAKQFIKDRAVYLAGQNGTAGNQAGLNPNAWARQEFLAYSVMRSPNRQDYPEWATQMLQFLKGQPVWDTDVATTLAFLVSSGKLEEITGQVYALRGTVVEFIQWNP